VFSLARAITNVNTTEQINIVDILPQNNKPRVSNTTNSSHGLSLSRISLPEHDLGVLLDNKPKENTSWIKITPESLQMQSISTLPVLWSYFEGADIENYRRPLYCYD
jgi:hypothetical protein